MSADADPGDVPIRAAPPTDALRLALETALDAVVVMRDDGIVADWNDQAVNVFGWTREEAVGRAMLRAVRDGGPTAVVDTREINRLGAPAPVRAS